MKVVIQTQSGRETIQFGKQIGKRLQSGDVVALIGELGAGKTHLIKGLARGHRSGTSLMPSPPPPSRSFMNTRGESHFTTSTFIVWRPRKKEKHWVSRNTWEETESPPLSGPIRFHPCFQKSCSGSICVIWKPMRDPSTSLEKDPDTRNW